MSDSRKRFEEWYEANAMPLEADWFRRDPKYPDEYLDVQSEWEAWQAAVKRELAEKRLGSELAAVKRKLAEAVKRAMERCAVIAEAECLDIGCTATEAEGVVRRTREAIANQIRREAGEVGNE